MNSSKVGWSSWLEEMDHATDMDDLDHVGFALSTARWNLRHSIQNCARNCEDKPSRFHEKIDLLKEKQYKERGTMRTSRQITHQVFSFFDRGKIPGRAISLTDLPNTELHTDKIKQFNLGKRRIYPWTKG